MSSSLCKKLEGAVFPLRIELVKDRIDHPVHALDVHKADHGPSSPPHLHKAALDHIGGAPLALEMSGEVKEAEQLGQVFLQLSHHRGITLAPPSQSAW